MLLTLFDLIGMIGSNLVNDCITMLSLPMIWGVP